MKASLWSVVVVLVVVLAIAGYIGILNPLSTQAPQTPIVVTPDVAADIFPDVASIQYTNTAEGFSMYRPATTESKTTSFESYLPLTQTPVVAFTIPNTMFEKTNLGEAGIYVGATTTPLITSLCMIPDASQGEVASSTRTINDVSFDVFTSNDAGAGNYYDRTALRTMYNGTCYEIVEMLHSAQIGNFPAGTVTPFDRNEFIGYLDAMVNTFAFTAPTTN